ncbi:MAG: DUF3465 domain-containing protein [Methylomonas sp.]|jgi:hypothetical protein|uniref:DUF3465 domain-containing protein n=1 Tax=Methylomonas sp. TaxID=418 RepID=UPI0025CBD465|nr:DUF3465 domain-containing protein [Methylomonas sp.]MCK9605255.1 DUF3465 domain-containing protein [Methylomonas sp.]
MNKVITLVALLLLSGGLPSVWADTPYSANDAVLEQAFRAQRSDLQIEGEGSVIKILPDDNHGSRHQRFILRLQSGQTLLIAHNIDLAPKIENLRVGETVSFYGEYEWSEKGGTVHWTHRDPGRRHIDGWLKVAGRVYQ